MNQRDSGDRGQLPILEAAAEIADRPGIGAPGVRVADLCCEKLQEVMGSAIAGIDDCRRHRQQTRVCWEIDRKCNGHDLRAPKGMTQS